MVVLLDSLRNIPVVYTALSLLEKPNDFCQPEGKNGHTFIPLSWG